MNNTYKKSSPVNSSGAHFLLKAGLAGLLASMLSVTALAQPARPGAIQPAAHADQEPINLGDVPNPYRTERNFGTLPDGRSWGSVSAVNIDIDGINVWAGDRCGSNSCATSDVDPIVKLDPDGNVLTSFGAGLIVWPHGMDVDSDGNVWVVDARAANERELEENPWAAGKGHTVLKFSPEGELLMTLGTPGEVGDPPTHFDAPNDVVIGPDGRIYVGDTHGAQFQNEAGPTAKSRIAIFEADGTFIKTFGEFGFEDGQFRSPHSLAFDSQGRLFVADRGNSRIQIFTGDGDHIDTWYQFSRISGIFIDKDTDMLYAIDSESDENYNPGWSKGLRVGSARTGEVMYFVPAHESERGSGMGGIGSMGEGVTVDRNGVVYAGEVGPIQGMTKFIPR